jgi:DNA-binding transcriptional LysR family regulator
MANFGRLDLNLLITLDVLLAEHNVTRAAQRLNLSQPAVSVHLAKLREFFGDPLLLPGPRGMLPTVRAEELREPLRQALEALGYVVSPAQPFDPAEARHTWSVMASDYGESTIVLPALAGAAHAQEAARQDAAVEQGQELAPHEGGQVSAPRVAVGPREERLQGPRDPGVEHRLRGATRPVRLGAAHAGRERAGRGARPLPCHAGHDGGTWRP